MSMVGQRVWPIVANKDRYDYNNGIFINSDLAALLLFQMEANTLSIKYYATEKERDEAELNDNLKTI